MTSSKSWFRTRYRIIMKSFNGYYQPQYRWWWWPFWMNLGEDGITICYEDISKAEAVIQRHRQPIVKEYD